MTNLVHRRQLRVEWGHCDPAGIVFNSRFFEFFDASTWLMFETALGAPASELETIYGIMGLPLVDAKARFFKPAKFNDVVEIASQVSEFRRSSFDVAHRLYVDGDLAVDASETRVWNARERSDPLGLRAIPIPAAVTERFERA
jgi:4-hydroxybenzoyl-CoA thioesterase